PDYLPDNEPTRREFAHLQKSIEHVDDGVARILDALEQTGQAENTLVIFTAEHGLPVPRAKGTLYDPGIQVAFLARWPRRIAPGSVSGSLTSNLDVMPTLLEAANAQIPTRVQGRSLLPLLLGKSADSGREAVFAEKTYHEHYDPIRCVRTEHLKYIRNFADRPRLVMPSDVYNSPTRQSMGEDERFWSHRPAEELYDLTADRGEVSNLAGSPEHREELGNLRARLEEWMQETADPLLKGPVPRVAPQF
ncbi:MAG: sulfatase-like hydrolase/transferase, partial [Pedosphaera parvula]|nr:sulfatase-like hydrolase/transferase [Pedosphaera parvula]